MDWNKLKPEIEKANRQIAKHRTFNTAFYAQQRMYWQGFKYGLGIAYKIYSDKL